MQPTMKLRFVIRKTGTFTARILQQWWEGIQGFGSTPEEFNKVIGEWRDVPIEEESK